MMAIQKTDEGLKAFYNHGFREDTTVGNQIVGDCPLCGKPKHFYINRDTKQWDCKKCGKSGGFQKFLHEVLETALSARDRRERLQVLAENRGLRWETLTEFDVCFNSATGEYLIPVYQYVGEERQVWDIRRGALGKPLHSTGGCNLGLLNWEYVNEYDRLWLCEGEWDAMACHELLRSLGVTTDLALGLPGARTLKAQWGSMFKDRNIICVYDADNPGREGALKAYNTLKSIAQSLLFVHWGEAVKDGYDLREAYKEQGKALFDRMLTSATSLPPGADASQLEVRGEERYKGPGTEASTVYEAYNKWLFMPDNVLIDVIFGTIIANRQSGHPLWMFIVAPPGGTKTEPLSSLLEAPDIVYKNTLGAKSLVSGQVLSGGADPSLLPRLHERMLVIEDFTTVLSIPPTFREEIFGILRSAYNGRYERDYGNGRVFRCECLFGILAGVTPAIEHQAENFTALGERFLSYAPPIPKDVRGRRPYLKKAQENRGHELEMRAELKRVAAEALNYPFSSAPIIPGGIEDCVLDLAQWTSLMRGVLKRDKYAARKEITHEPFSELGTRLVKQYSKLLDGIGRFKRLDIVGEEEYSSIRRIAYSSVPSDRRRVLRAMSAEPGKAWSSGEVSEATGLPRYPMCERVAETLSMLGVLKRENAMRQNLWRIENDFVELIESTHIFSGGF